VAVSRARDQLIVFHSIRKEDLKPDDLRYILLYYIEERTFPDEQVLAEKETIFESSFERDVYEYLTRLGYAVTPQVKVGHYRIDLVVEGDDKRLGIECDGDRWHPPERWWHDQLRQRQLERMGWTICRVWASAFYKDRDLAMAPIIRTLTEIGINPNKQRLPTKYFPLPSGRTNR